MKDLSAEAAAYAANKTNEVITKAIAQAYAEGYQKGYKDGVESIPVDLRNGNTEFVDLGLPSGTLWAKDYVKENGKLLYLPYCKAEQYQLPTKEQWTELVNTCRFLYESYSETDKDLRKATCIGPNGKFIIFEGKGRHRGDDGDYDAAYMWLREKSDTYTPNAVSIRYKNKDVIGVFSGYKLPIRLVKQQ